MKLCRKGLHQYDISEERCPKCRKENKKQWHRNHAQESKQKRQTKYKAFRSWIKELKSSGCIECGRMLEERMLHFHHRDPNTKLFEIHDGYSRSYKNVLNEIEKCDLVCANCHPTLEGDNHA